MSLFSCSPLLAQSWIGEKGSNCLNKTIDEVCDVGGSFSSPVEAEQNLKEILDIAGISRTRFAIRECSNIDNVKAVILKNSKGVRKNYILYNNDFIERFSHFGGDRDWGATSIIAHEVGHLANFHGLNCEGSNHENELEADEYSGVIMAKLGATLNQATAAVDKIPYHHATDTHPSKAKRKAAIKKGWLSVKGENKDILEKESMTTAEIETWLKKYGAEPLFNLAKQNNVIAIRRLAKIYDFGIIVDRNYETANTYWKKAVAIGDRYAEYALGFNYYRGYGIKKDIDKAAKLYDTSCKKGLKAACKELKKHFKTHEEESATIEKIWVDHNVTVNNLKGMRIHVKLNVYHKKDEKVKVLAYFSFKSGTPLKDFNDSYSTTSGNVSVSKSITPSYDSSTFNDVSFFMPYNELHMSCKTPGKAYSLYFEVQLHSTGSDEFIHKEPKKYFFNYTCAK